MKKKTVQLVFDIVVSLLGIALGWCTGKFLSTQPINLFIDIMILIAVACMYAAGVSILMEYFLNRQK
jgi:hypothetical protein